jgi:ribosomal protein L7/L12
MWFRYRPLSFFVRFPNEEKMPPKPAKNHSDSTVYITRKEFHSEIMIVWMILTMILLELSNQADGRKKTGVFIVAAVAFTFWMISIFRLRKENQAQPQMALPPLSDTVKQIASDPSRKVEAIKAYKDETDLGLADAKRAVEEHIAGFNNLNP